MVVDSWEIVWILSRVDIYVLGSVDIPELMIANGTCNVPILLLSFRVLLENMLILFSDYRWWPSQCVAT